ncbi:hypothetical protein FACS1894205_4530 [Alphaproteobacteria bacterium]|nr:hypothetical protein FACS1894205_4530 [Alphaproteobacteria bacterium]
MTRKPLSVVAFAPGVPPFVPLLGFLQKNEFHIISAGTDVEAVRPETLKGADAVLFCVASPDASCERALSSLVKAAAPPVILFVSEPVSAEKELRFLELGAQEVVYLEKSADIAAASERTRRAVLRSVLRRNGAATSKVNEQNRRYAEAQAVLDLFPAAVIITDGGGRILLANHEAQTLITQKDAMFVDSSNRIHLSSQPQNAVLYQTIAKVSQGVDTDCALIAPKRSDGYPLSVMVVPVISNGDNKKTGVTLFITDPKQPIDIAPATLEGLYGFTAAESRLVISLVSGRTLEEVSGAAGTSLNTLRNHLKSAFRKTDTSRQAELVKLVLTGPALFRRRTG